MLLVKGLDVMHNKIRKEVYDPLLREAINSK